jgi:hypothetical protein
MLDFDPAFREKHNALLLLDTGVKHQYDKEVVLSCWTPIQHPEKNIRHHYYWILVSSTSMTKEEVLVIIITGFCIKYGMTKRWFCHPWDWCMFSNLLSLGLM